MQQWKSEAKGQKKKPEWPETYRIEEGKHVVAMACERRDRVGPNEQTVFECVIRGQEEKIYTIWWPFRLPMPPMMTPFYLKRLSRVEWVLYVSEAEVEHKDLWRRGEEAILPNAEVSSSAVALPLKASDRLRSLNT